MLNKSQHIPKEAFIFSNTKKKRLYNSRIIDSYIKLIKKKYNHIDVQDILEYAGITLYEVADEGHWFTQDQINRFHEKLSQLTKNELIAREAGRYAASPDAIGIMRPFLLGMVEPARVYEMIGKAAGKFTKSSTYESRIRAANKVEIIVTPRIGVQEKQFQCENRKGFFEAIALAYTNKLPTLEHTECIFKGGDACRYQISWEKSSSVHWRRLRNITMILPILAVLFFPILQLFYKTDFSYTALTTIIPAWLAIVSLLSFISSIVEKKDLMASLNHLHDSTDALMEQVNINYNNALMTNEIGQAISKQTNSREILRNVVHIFRKRLNYDRGMVLLADRDKKRLLFRAGYGYTEEQLKLLKNTAFHLDKPRSKGVLVISFKKQRPFLINDINNIAGDLSLRSLSFAKKLGTQSFICCPITCDGEPLGILAVDNLKSKKPLVKSDISLLMGIASVLGISIRNADLMEARERQFRSVLHALAASIDARDPLTSGHSEKVTEYALGICDELGLPDDYCKVIRVAALLHDYGKIGVPDAILKKPGKLTSEEYEIVKTHSNKTRRILNQINFEGIYSQVPEIAGCHHEKVDGSGYPDGLRGDEIPLGAKIIAVADFFEAITARRHYRGPMPIDDAFKLLKKEFGKSFEKEIVDALLNYHSKKHAGRAEYRLAMYTG